jgi:hypothetical protein
MLFQHVMSCTLVHTYRHFSGMCSRVHMMNKVASYSEIFLSVYEN